VSLALLAATRDHAERSSTPSAALDAHVVAVCRAAPDAKAMSGDSQSEHDCAARHGEIGV
jgi:hypothetical protein